MFQIEEKQLLLAGVWCVGIVVVLPRVLVLWTAG